VMEHIFDLLADSYFRYTQMERYQFRRSSHNLKIMPFPKDTKIALYRPNCCQLLFIRSGPKIAPSPQKIPTVSEVILNSDHNILCQEIASFDNAVSVIDVDDTENKYQEDDIEDINNINVAFWSTMNGYNVRIKYLLRIKEQYEQNMVVYKTILSMKQNKNEKMLFHGTSLENIQSIIYKGFNRDFNERSKYGKGSYFTNDASKALKYAKQSEKGRYFGILVCRVFVGESTLGMMGMSESALVKSDGTLYDSLVDNLDHPTITVINRDYHAIPVYLIILQ